jgi:hypothetical protein
MYRLPVLNTIKNNVGNFLLTEGLNIDDFWIGKCNPKKLELFVFTTKRTTDQIQKTITVLEKYKPSFAGIVKLTDNIVCLDITNVYLEEAPNISD